MEAAKARLEFQKNKKIYDSALLRFEGVHGWDVYNCSVPFVWQGKEYIFGRVERREDFANSTAWLFEKTGPDAYAPVAGSMIYPLEDPFLAVVDGEWILGGTHVRKSKGKIDHFCGYFYRGSDPRWMTHFTCGPADMKDIRLVQLQDGRIGVFSRPRSATVEKQYGSGAVIGFTTISSVDELDAQVINHAPVIKNLFGPGEWGGCNQCYLLRDGRIGVIGHRSYNQTGEDGGKLMVYMNISFIFDPATHSASDIRIIGDKPSYPPTEAMRPDLRDCAFTSGIVMRPDGRAELYSGLGDVTEGRVTIDAPFGSLLGEEGNLKL